jgi:hypothetical protein
MTTIKAPIGGFFGLHEPEYCATKQSILWHWTNGRPFAAFVSARSALDGLIASMAPRQIWIPSYICDGLIADSWRDRVRYYPLTGLEPQVASLDRAAGSGDMVLGVDFFGYPPRDAFISFTRRRSDLLFVENRAQALDPGIAPWGDWTLYSPRKLVGVADGGILVAERAGRTVPQPSERPDAIALWTAPLLRYEDFTEENNQAWHEAHQSKKAWMHADRAAMTRLSTWILSRTPIELLAGRRRRNWQTLHDHLAPWLTHHADREAAPFGYLIKVASEQRPAILRGLHAERIFAAVHYPTLPSPADEYPAEHELRRELITLPCDHRYDESIMRVMAERVLGLIA